MPNNNFDPGDILKQGDYAKKSNRNLALAAILFVGLMVAFVLPLLK